MFITPDSHQKQRVMDEIVKRKNPRFYPLILAALRDPQAEINQYAVAKVQKLRHEYEMKISKATEAVNVLPASIDAHYHLALSYCEYIESGLMDPSVAHFFQTQFKNVYRKILAFPHFPTEEPIFNDLGQLSLQMKHWNEAESAYRKALELQPDNIEANMGFIKLFYERRMYAKTFKQIHRIQEVTASGAKTPSRIRELTRCWLPAGVGMDEDDR
jgi:tetratricopeptide (TPR) repeat protein